jgi:hypothetical protein
VARANLGAKPRDPAPLDLEVGTGTDEHEPDSEY